MFMCIVSIICCNFFNSKSAQGKYKTAGAVYEKILDTYRDIHMGETVELADTLLGFGYVLCLNDDLRTGTLSIVS